MNLNINAKYIHTLSILLADATAAAHYHVATEYLRKGKKPGRVVAVSGECKETHGLDKRGLFYIREGKKVRYSMDDKAACTLEVLAAIFHHWPDFNPYD